MKCQVPGCKNEAKHVIFGSGIYHGICLNNQFCHCDHHDDDELTDSFETFCSERAEAMQMVNPMLDVQKKLQPNA